MKIFKKETRKTWLKYKHLNDLKEMFGLQLF